MKYILFLLVTLFPITTFADNYYVDIDYKKGKLILPEKKSKFSRFFSDDKKTLIVTATILLREKGRDTILLPPSLLESFEIVNDKLKRIKSENISLQTGFFKKPNEQIRLKVDFYSINKSSVNKFTKALVEMADAYSDAVLTPGVSKVAQAAIDLMGFALHDNKDIALTYVGGIDLDKERYSKELYFDDNGIINNTPIGSEKTTATITFDINGYEERRVDYNLGFKEQVGNDEAKILFDNFNSMTSAINKKNACLKLHDYLKETNTLTSAENLLAVAINSARWPQDETKQKCMDAKKARNFRSDYDLEYIVKCKSFSCVQTKDIILALSGVSIFSELNPLTGGVNLSEKGCFKDRDIKDISGWKGFEPVKDGESFSAYKFTNCMKLDDEYKRYSHTLGWLGDKVFSHACEVIDDKEKICNK